MEICIFCTTDKELTTEHIIPEFMGGTLKFTRVCKSCNSKMGSSFEQSLANNILFKMPIYLHEIEGKDKRIKFPFSGVYTIKDFGRVEIGSDASLNVLPDINIREKDEKVEIEISLDPDKLHSGKGMLGKRLIRHFKTKGSTLEKENLSNFIETYFEEANRKYQRISNPELHIDFEINVNDLRLLYTKIAYEIAWFRFGNDYLADPVANVLRNSVLNLKVPSYIRGDVPLVSNSFACSLDDTFHWILLTKNICYIRLFGIPGIVQYTSRNSLFKSNQGCIYKFSYKSGARKCEVISLKKTELHKFE